MAALVVLTDLMLNRPLVDPIIFSQTKKEIFSRKTIRVIGTNAIKISGNPQTIIAYLMILVGMTVAAIGPIPESKCSVRPIRLIIDLQQDQACHNLDQRHKQDLHHSLDQCLKADQLQLEEEVG
jgi:hypothetical protein